MSSQSTCMQIIPNNLPDPWDNEIIESSENLMTIRSNIKCMDDINKWVSDFGVRTNTHWNMRRSLPQGKTVVCSKKFVCHHSSFMKVKREESRSDVSKNSGCTASITVQIKLNTANTRRRDPFVKKGLCGVIFINTAHIHSLNTGETLRFLPADATVKGKFIEYFNNGMGIAESSKFHERVIELQEEYAEENMASGRINPTKRSIRLWHDEWRSLNLGPRTGIGLLEKLKEKQAAYKEQGITVLFSDCPFALVIVTPLMKRAHALETSKEIVFVDSTSSCDAENHSITFVLTTCAAGAVPLGIIITKGQTEEAYTQGFRLLLEAVPGSFYGRKYPNIFMTDHSLAEINSIKSVWPLSKNLLCIFHVSQAVWRWLCNTKQAVTKECRPILMAAFQSILYSRTKQEAEASFQKAYESGCSYSSWQNYLGEYWEIREQWCLAWRDETSRGHHTNNFSEVAVRLFKDTVLSRVKAYNVIALVDFTCTVLEEYYCHRFREFSNSRESSKKLLFKSLMKKTSYLQEGDIFQNNGNEFLVPSEKNNSEVYCVNVTSGVCSCADGQFGKFCKHQCAVYKFFNVASKSFPAITSLDRFYIARLALGDKAPPFTFFQPFMLEESREEVTVPVSGITGHEVDTMESSNIPSQQEETLFNKEILQKILHRMKECDREFGSSSSGLKKQDERLNKIRSVGQWETFLHTAGNSIPLRRQDGIPIRVHPTSLARRSAQITRGSKRLPSGRPAFGEHAKKKRKRNLAVNVRLNQANSKTH